MVPGAMQTKRVRSYDWEYRWLPPAEDAPPPEPAAGPGPEPGDRRTKPRDDPWEEKGFFGRRKKPDWEK